MELQSKSDARSHISGSEGVNLYLKEIRYRTLLKADEEIRLSNIIQNGNSKEAMIARNKLVESNLKLVVNISKKYVNRGVSFEDLIQSGNEGLMKAAEKYNSDLGCKFATYATWWIRQYIKKYIADTMRTVRIPRDSYDRAICIKRKYDQLSVKLGRYPTMAELSEALKISEKKIEEILYLNAEIISLDFVVSEDEDTCIDNFIVDSSNPIDEVIIDKIVMKKFIEKSFQYLREREIEVLQMRYGLIDDEPRTLDYISKKMHVTIERVRQIEANALKKIRAKNKIQVSSFNEYY